MPQKFYSLRLFLQALVSVLVVFVCRLTCIKICQLLWNLFPSLRPLYTPEPFRENEKLVLQVLRDSKTGIVSETEELSGRIEWQELTTGHIGCVYRLTLPLKDKNKNNNDANAASSRTVRVIFKHSSTSAASVFVSSLFPLNHLEYQAYASTGYLQQCARDLMPTPYFVKCPQPAPLSSLLPLLVLIMEDLSADGNVRGVRSADGLNLEDSKTLMRWLGEFHSRTWGHFADPSNKAAMLCATQDIYWPSRHRVSDFGAPMVIGRFLEKHPLAAIWRKECPRMIRALERLRGDLKLHEEIKYFFTGYTTLDMEDKKMHPQAVLCHGDCRADNVLFTTTGDAATADKKNKKKKQEEQVRVFDFGVLKVRGFCEDFLFTICDMNIETLEQYDEITGEYCAELRRRVSDAHAALAPLPTVADLRSALPKFVYRISILLMTGSQSTRDETAGMFQLCLNGSRRVEKLAALTKMFEE